MLFSDRQEFQQKLGVIDSNVVPKFPTDVSCMIVGKQLEQGRTLDKREYVGDD